MPRNTFVALRPLAHRALVSSLAALVGVLPISGAMADDTAAQSEEAAAEVTASIASRWTLPSTASDMATDPAVVWGVLPNGLTYAMLPNEEPKDKVTLRLFVGVGSMDETDEIQGMAHYLEHLAFNGSENFPPGTLIERLQEWGIGFGSQANAHTSFEETVYKLDLPDADQATVALGLQVMADYAGRLLIEKAEVDNERGVILAEMRDRESPRMRTFRKVYSALYAGTRVGDRFPIGTKEAVEAINHEQMRAYYDTYYRPANMVLTVTGTIDPKQLEEKIAAEFNTLAAEELPAFYQLPDLPPVATPTFIYHEEPEAASGWVGFADLTPRPKGIEQAAQVHSDLAFELMTLVLNRRMQAAIEAAPDGPLLGASCYVYDYFTYRHAGWRGQPKPGQELAALQQIQAWWRQSLQYPPQPAEVNAAAAAFLASLENQFNKLPTGQITRWQMRCIAPFVMGRCFRRRRNVWN